MAATKQSRAVRSPSSERARPRSGAAPRARSTRKGNTGGRLIHHSDAAALWRGLCVSCRASLQRISHNVQQLFRDAGANLERLRERAAVPDSVRAESSSAARGSTASAQRGAGTKRSNKTASGTSSRKTASPSTAKKPAAAKRTAQKKTGTTGSRKTTQRKATSGRTTRRAAKARGATTGTKRRTGRKK
jgi:hypothetical protein